MKQGQSNTGIIEEKVTIQMTVTIIISGEGHYNTMTRGKVKKKAYGEGHKGFTEMKVSRTK